MSDTVYKLMAGVEEHPDCIWATVFTWDDISQVLDELQTDERVPSGVMVSQIRALPEAKQALSDAIGRACMGSGDWSDAVEHTIIELAEKIQ